MFNIVLFGPPGSGKGTQAQQIMNRYLLGHLSTGDMLRQEISERTDLGKKAQAIMDSGKLVSDEVVIGMIKNRLSQKSDTNGFIFDGFPRTVEQAKALDQLLEDMEEKITTVISLKVGEDELVKRLMQRAETSGREDDKDEEVIRNRIDEYRLKTEPVADFYAATGRLREIEGEESIDEVMMSIVLYLDQLS